jgi:hypothetical protein
LEAAPAVEEPRVPSSHAPRRPADYGCVWSPTFAEVLDEAIGGGAGPAVAGRGAAAATHQPMNPFVSFALPTMAGARAAFARATAALGEGLAASATVRTRRRARTLTPPQRCALDLLCEAGANLSPDFTADELRGEYRLLARRMHPDRHPDANAFQRALLSRRFAEVAEGYRCLAAAGN